MARNRKYEVIDEREACAEKWRQLRWRGEVRCVRCDSESIEVRQRNYRGYLYRYFCKHCRTWFSDLTNTPLSNSKVRLSDWFYLMEELKTGKSVLKIAEERQINYKTALQMSKIAPELRLFLFNEPLEKESSRTIEISRSASRCVRKTRINQGWSVDELAGKAEISTRQLYRIEKSGKDSFNASENHEKDSFNAAALHRVATALEVDLKVILEGYWNVPHPRNIYFTGRNAVLKRLRAELRKNRCTVISGLGGMGKTQTAVAYAYRNRNAYDATLWVEGESQDSLASGFVKLAGVLSLPDKDVEDQNLAVAAVKAWLQKNEDWLLIIDNADEPMLIQWETLLPPDLTGHLLLTSRARRFERVGVDKPILLEKMTAVEARTFLIERVGRGKQSAREREAVDRLATELDYLPLALEQAAAYICQIACGFSDYLTSYRNRGLELLEKMGVQATEYPKSVATTWALNFDQVSQASEASADLLRFFAFLNPDSIPLEIIEAGATELSPAIAAALAHVDKNPLARNELVEPLTRYSLVRHNDTEGAVSIHRLVQSVIRENMTLAEQKLWAERAVRAVNCAFPFVDYVAWARCEKLLPHALACAALIEEWAFEFEEAAYLLNGVVLYLNNQAQYAKALPLAQRALKIREKVFPEGHKKTAKSLSNLALCYWFQGKYSEALPFLQRGLEIAEKMLQQAESRREATLDDCSHVAAILNNLGSCYIALGKYDAALPPLQRGLKIQQQKLEEIRRAPSLGDVRRVSQHVATNEVNLALVYTHQGNYTQALELLQRALAVRLNTLYHAPKTVECLHLLGVVYRSKGQFDYALKLFQQALKWREEMLHKDHPEIAESKNELGEFYLAQGDFAQARSLLVAALEIRERVLPEGHPDIAKSRKNLERLENLEPFDDAEKPDALSATSETEDTLFHEAINNFGSELPLYLWALETLKQTYGEEYPLLAEAHPNVAGGYSNRGEYEKALSHLKRALEICEKAYGVENFFFASRLHYTAEFVYARQSRYSKALSLNQRALEICQRTVGDNHPWTEKIWEACEHCKSRLRETTNSESY